MIPLEDQVPTLELCKELKELGYPQEGLFYHVRVNPDDDGFMVCYFDKRYQEVDESYVAPTVAEMGEWLPYHTSSMLHPMGYRWVVTFIDVAEAMMDTEIVLGKKDVFEHRIGADTEANARAKMLIWLAENDYLVLGKGGKDE